MALFVSTFVNKIDRKGRISVPASFRAALVAEPFQGIVAYPSFTSAAIEGCTLSFLEDLADAASDTFEIFSPDQDRLNTLIFSQSHQLAFDPEGRVALPEVLLAHAGIKDQAAFVGMGRSFRIWEPQALADYQAEVRAQAIETPPRLTLRRRSTP